MIASFSITGFAFYVAMITWRAILELSGTGIDLPRRWKIY